jgi:hypothetical protein
MNAQTLPPELVWGTRLSDPVDDERIAQQAFADSDWWVRSGMEPHWPLTTRELVLLLHRGGQFVITESKLLAMVDARIVPRHSVDEDGRHEWSAFDAAQVGGTLEGRRQWVHPSFHDAKRHPCELLVQQARRDGTLRSIAHPGGGLPRQDLQSLYALLMNCDSREGREKIGALLKAVLEVEHGVTIL